jgi:hypothetical protein
MSVQTPLDLFGPTAVNDFANFFLGNVLDEGCYRKVFLHAVYPKRYVIKYEKSDVQFANVTEYMIWNELAATPIGRCLAPVRAMSPCGIWLIQDRCEPLAKRDAPRKVPSFLADLKVSNWGWLRDRPVCFDYGNHKLFTHAARSSRLVKRKWR